MKTFTVTITNEDGSVNYRYTQELDETVEYHTSQKKDRVIWELIDHPKEAETFVSYDVPFDGSVLWVAVGSADGTDAHTIISHDQMTWTDKITPA